MADFLDMLRDFTHFTEKIERDMYETAKRLQLPDEIDLYNFFEKWSGRAFCVFENFQFTPLDPRCDYNCQSLLRYLSLYSRCSQIKYYIGKNRYYAINFNSRGVFLVSEKRYNELKAKKK